MASSDDVFWVTRPDSDLDSIEDLRGDSRPYLDQRAVGLVVVAAGRQACGMTLQALRGASFELRADLPAQRARRVVRLPPRENHVPAVLIHVRRQQLRTLEGGFSRERVEEADGRAPPAVV